MVGSSSGRIEKIFLVKIENNATQLDRNTLLAGKNFSKLHFEMFPLIFSRNMDLTLHANCLLRRQFA